MTSKLDIPLHEASLSIVRRCGADLCEIIYSKFGCVAAIEGVENESRTSYRRSPAAITPEKRFEFMMHSGVTVSVWKADLTNFRADAVVNAANEDLKHYGGLALALSDAGGPQIQKESDDYIKRHGKLQTGEAVALGPGSLLTCKTIIHAVGPNLPSNPSQEDVHRATTFLQKAIWNILNKVDQHHLATVAIPAISSGLFNYPLPECADVIVSTIKQYYDKLPSQNHRPNEVFLANHDDPTVREMERACHRIFGPQQQQTYSKAVAQNTRSAGNAPQPSVTIGNVLLTLKKGKIEEQNTDVIVNTASEDRKLNQGLISKAILDKAGYEIQKEINRATKQGSIFCTKGHQLKCKEVYHAICTAKGTRNPAEWVSSENLLHYSVLDCLAEARKKQHLTISFPAIGTGNLGFPKRKSASIMSKAVAEFAERNQCKLDVYFVIFPSDLDTYQAFEAEIRALQERVSNFMSATASRPEDFHTTRASIPKIILLGPSDESKREAEKWITDLLYKHKPIEIKNNFISHFCEGDYRALAHLANRGMSIEEFFSQGHACLTVKGKPEENAVIAALQVEAMLCKIHKDFIAEEELQLKMLTDMNVFGEKKTVDTKSQVFAERFQPFKPGLWVVKVEKVENAALTEMFNRKKKQLNPSSTKKMFQRIPAQFCEMISRIGFHAECAPPEDPKYGEGIYFAQSIKTALDLWREKGEEYLYFVEAEVLLGNSAKGERGFILPPPVGKGSNDTYDSVYGGSDVSVIFSGYQALPKYIITCKKNSHSS